MGVPVKKFAAGAVQAAVWENEGREGGKFNSVSIQRNYKDKDNQWKSNSSLRVNDLPKAIAVLQKAYEYLVLKETGAESSEEGEKALSAELA